MNVLILLSYENYTLKKKPPPQKKIKLKQRNFDGINWDLYWYKMATSVSMAAAAFIVQIIGSPLLMPVNLGWDSS